MGFDLDVSIPMITVFLQQSAWLFSEIIVR